MPALTHRPSSIKQKLFVLILLALGTVIAFFSVRTMSPVPTFGQQVYHAVTPVPHRSAH